MGTSVGRKKSISRKQDIGQLSMYSTTASNYSKYYNTKKSSLLIKHSCLIDSEAKIPTSLKSVFRKSSYELF